MLRMKSGIQLPVAGGRRKLRLIQFFLSAALLLPSSATEAKGADAAALYDSASVSYGRGDFTEAAALYREFISLGPVDSDSGRYLAGMRMLGDAYRYGGLPDSALKAYNRALVKAETWGSDYDAAMTWNDLGLFHNSFGRFVEAAAAYLNALEKYPAGSDSTKLGLFSNNLGGVYSGLGEHDKAFEYFSRAYEINMALGKEDLAVLPLANMGLIYLIQGEYEKAITLNGESLAIAEKEDFPHGEAWSLLNMGKAQYRSGQVQVGIQTLRESRRRYADIGNLDGVGLCALELGLIHQQSAALDSALHYYGEAEKAFHAGRHEQHSAELLLHLADLRLERQEYGEALRSVKAGLTLSEKNDYTEQRVRFHDLAAEVYIALGDTASALPAMKMAREFEQQLSDQSLRKNLKISQLEFERSRISSENMLLKQDALIKDLKIRRTLAQRNLTVTLMAAALIILLLLVNRSRTVRRYTTALEKTNEAISDKNHQLKLALDNVKELKGLLPICASCKKIRDDGGYWESVESYISHYTDAEFTHGICPDCAEKLYPEYIHNDRKDKDP